jgi:uncharacterized membrane protein YidH (DUF202 family)
MFWLNFLMYIGPCHPLGIRIIHCWVVSQNVFDVSIFHVVSTEFCTISLFFRFPIKETQENKMNTINILRSRMLKSKSPSLMEGERQESDTGTDTSSRDPVQVEPKTYFANERTFIQWISAALLLLTVSSIMMGSGNYNGTSSVIAFSSLVLVVYAVFTYFRRVNLLRTGEAYGYLDFVGPTILAAGVGVGVFIVFADAVKGSEFLPFGKENKDDNRRFLAQGGGRPEVLQSSSIQEQHERPQFLGPFLHETKGSCIRHSMEGINLLEYQPQDILLKEGGHEFLIVATSQALVAHPLLLEDTQEDATTLLSEISNVEIQSTIFVGDRLLALSTGPSKTELIEFQISDDETHAELLESSRFVIQEESTSAVGSMVFVPSSSSSSSDNKNGKVLLYLDGVMHSYQLSSAANKTGDDDANKKLLLSLTGSINMKVLNRGVSDKNDDRTTITAMEHFEGVTYILRHNNILEAWDLTQQAALLSELTLPGVPSRHDEDDRWVGVALERRRRRSSSSEEEMKASNLRNGGSKKNDEQEKEESTSVFLHMPLDTFPPQLWSFRLEEQQLDGQHSILSLPNCDGQKLLN